MPNTGISPSVRWPNASRLRCTCLATSRSASSASLAIELVDSATNSAKSSMSIFSSCARGAELGRHHVEAARRPAARSPHRPGRCPRSRRSRGRIPATFTAASTSGSAWLISEPKSRVASERMNTASRVAAPLRHPKTRSRRSRSCGCDRRAGRRPLFLRDGSIEIDGDRPADRLVWSRRRAANRARRSGSICRRRRCR